MSSQIITIDNIEPKVITIDNVATEVFTVETIETITIEGVGIQGATGATGSGGIWGTITGTLSDQIDLKNQQDAQDSAIALNTAKVTFPEAPEDGSQYARKDAGWEIVSADVDSVNGQTGIVVLDTDDIDDSTQINKYTTAGDISKLAGIEAGAQVNTVDSVNAKTGVVVINPDDLDDSATVNKFVTAAQITVIDNQSGVNTGDQDISGIATNAADITAIEDTAVFKSPVSPFPVNYIWLGNEVDYFSIVSPSVDTIYNTNNDLAIQAFYFRTIGESPVSPSIVGTVADWHSGESVELHELSTATPSFNYNSPSNEHAVSMDNVDLSLITDLNFRGLGITEISTLAGMTSADYLDVSDNALASEYIDNIIIETSANGVLAGFMDISGDDMEARTGASQTEYEDLTITKSWTITAVPPILLPEQSFKITDTINDVTYGVNPAISAWVDNGSLGQNLTQTNPSNQPTVVTGGVPEDNYIDFGDQDSLTNLNQQTGNFTYFADISFELVNKIVMRDSVTTAFIRYDFTNKLTIRSDQGVTYTLSVVLSLSTFYDIAIRKLGSTMTCFVNGVAETPVNVGTDTFTMDTLGGSFGGYFKAKQLEVFDYALTDSQIGGL